MHGIPAQTRFRWLCREIDHRATEAAVDMPLLSVSSVKGVVPRSELTDALPRANDLSNYKRCARGDVVLNRMSAYQGALGLARSDGIVSPDYAVLRPTDLVVDRYFAYLMRSDWFIGLMTQRLRGIGAPGTSSVRTPRVNIEDLGNIEVAVPPTHEQQRIADFLDDQVARLDGILDARRRQLNAISQLTPAIAAEILAPFIVASGPPLSAVAAIVDTEHNTAPDAPGGGYWSAGTSAVRGGSVIRCELREIDKATYAAWTRRAVPRPGDILLTREAPVGEVGLLSDDHERLAIGQRVVLLKPTTQVDSEFLRLVLMSPVLGRLISDAVQGSLHPHLNMADIARLRVPLPNSETQRKLGAAFTADLASARKAQTTQRRVIALTEELKRSLITAAVTGDFDVSSADGSRMPV